MDGAQTQIERQRMDVDIVCVGFDTLCGLRSQIVTSNPQTSYPERFVFSNPVTTA
jgi:hypothetical protein